ncbi:MAG: TM0996/MTH895 family glutaredoxin-like protein [Candidatus Altiarchaeota archaeon]|nr:TM0996/MTH895 family glutaredoxin-like protein [Candidatus Altiarchaeota archaeon]
MKIEILGTGCLKCKKLMENAEKAVEEAGVAAEIFKVTELERIISYGVMMTPALVFDGNIMCSGKIPAVEEIVEWIKDADKK